MKENQKSDGTKATIIQLLETMADAREIRQYLSRFSGQPGERFAVIKVGGKILEESPDALASSLSFLNQVGLIPVVVHGGGPQIDMALKKAGIETSRVNGLRVTTPEALQVIRRVFHAENSALVEALEALGTRARPITSGVFEGDFLDRDTYGLVGTVTGCHVGPVKSALQSGALPVLLPLAETPSGQILNVNGDTAARHLIKALKPYKIIFLSETGGLLDNQGSLIETVNLATDYEGLLKAPWLTGGMRLKVEEISELLDTLPLTSSVSITRPEWLAKELFTHRGSGTLIRRGEKIHIQEGLGKLKPKAIINTIETSFQEKLTDDYIASLAPDQLIYSESLRALALVDKETGFAWLDKFAVTEEAKGEGLGRTIWQTMTGENPKLVWRARPNNAINDFYFRQSDGHLKLGKWLMFWRGLLSHTDTERAINLVHTKPKSFRE